MASARRSIRTTSPSSATARRRRTTASGAPAGSTPTSSTSSTTPGSHAADEDEPLRVALVVFDARRSCDVRLAAPDAPTAGTTVVALESLDDLADRMTEDERQPDTCSAPYRVRFDEAAPDGLLRTSVLLRYAQDLAWYHSAERGFDRAWYAERGLTWLARAAEVAVLGADRRRRRAGRHDPGRRLAPGLGAAPDRLPSTRPGRSWRGRTSTGSCSTPAGRRPGSRRTSSRASARPTATFPLGRVALDAIAR